MSNKPVPTIVVLAKFLNGFMNGYILENDYKSNIEDVEAEIFDLDYLMTVWKTGMRAGRFHRISRNN